MKTKVTLLCVSAFFAASLSAQVQTVSLNLSGGSYMGTAIPDYTKWYYFSFEQGDTIGSSAATLENVNQGNVGTEIIDAAWKARTDWDIAFHASDIRTNSGLAGNASAGSLKIADTTSVKPLNEIFDDLTVAPVATYDADAVLTGSFIFGMTSMPPLRTSQLSASAAANGWAAFGMSGSGVNPSVIVFKMSDGRYAKVYLKSFSDNNGKPGVISFDYQIIPFAGASDIAADENKPVSVYLNPASDELNLSLPEKAAVVIYNAAGYPIKQVNVQSGQTTIPVSGWTKGVYTVLINDGRQSYAQKVIVK
jgi:hypothetical protein